MVYVVKCSAVKKWQQSSGKGYDDAKIITHPYKRQTRSLSLELAEPREK